MSLSGDFDPYDKLSLKEIFREEDAIRKRILTKIESTALKQKALERLKKLREINDKLPDIPSNFVLNACQQEENKRNEDFMQICHRYYKSLNTGRVIMDNFELKDANNKPLYSLSTLIWIKSLRAPVESIKSIDVTYHIKDEVVDRHYDLNNPEIPIPLPDNNQVVNEAQPSTSQFTLSTPTLSTPVTNKEKPQTINCTTGTFINGEFQPINVKEEVVVNDKSLINEQDLDKREYTHNSTMEQLLKSLRPTQTKIIDVTRKQPNANSCKEDDAMKSKRKRSHHSDSSKEQGFPKVMGRLATPQKRNHLG